VATDKQMRANRQNAQKSTGPRTLKGKQVSSGNAVKHGIFAQGIVADGLEQSSEWASHLHSMKDEFKPDGYFENLLVERIAGLLWRLHRVARHEGALLKSSSDPMDFAYEDVPVFLPNPVNISLITRYESNLHRQFMQILHELQRRQVARIEGVTTPPLAVDVTIVEGERSDAD
jgi:hypothetical protein